VAKDELSFMDTDQRHVSLGEYPRFNSVNGWIVYAGDRWERLTAVRICKYVRGAGKTALRVGSTAGQCNAACSFQQRLLILAMPKARSSGKG